MDHFKSLLDIIKHACNEGESRVVNVTGDFNIDFAKRYAPDYANRCLSK